MRTDRNGGSGALPDLDVDSADGSLASGHMGCLRRSAVQAARRRNAGVRRCVVGSHRRARTMGWRCGAAMGISASSVRRSRRRAILDPLLEALDRPAEIRTQATQLFGTKDQKDDHQDDQPMPDAE